MNVKQAGETSKDINNAVSRKVAQDQIELDKEEFYKNKGKPSFKFGDEAPIKKDKTKNIFLRDLAHRVKQCLSIKGNDKAYLYERDGKISVKGCKDAGSRRRTSKWILKGVFNSVAEVKNFKF